MKFYPPVKCEHCDFIVYGKSPSVAARCLKYHFQAHHVLKHCEYCEFKSLSIVEVKKHKNKVHFCKKCDFIAANIDTLKKHLRFHSWKKQMRLHSTGAGVNCDYFVVI